MTSPKRPLAYLGFALGTFSFLTLACDSTLSSQGTAGATGTGGQGGGAGTGTGGTGSSCRTAEDYLPGQCDPTFAQQVQRAVTRTCDRRKVYTGTCGGVRVWSLTYQGTGDPVWCFYDADGAFVGEVICTDFVNSCDGWESFCFYSGTTPSLIPSVLNCPDGELTAYCDSLDGGTDR